MSHLSSVFHYILSMHIHGPYGNLKDRLISDFVGMLLLSFCKCYYSKTHLLDVTSDTVVSSVNTSKPSIVRGQPRVEVKDNYSVSNQKLSVHSVVAPDNDVLVILVLI